MKKTTRREITARNVKRMQELRDSGLSIPEVAKRVHRAKSVVYRALRNAEPAEKEQKVEKQKTMRDEIPGKVFAVLHPVEGGRAKVAFHDAESAFKYFLSVDGEATLSALETVEKS